MLTMIAAALAAAQTPSAPAQTAPPAQHKQHQQGHPADHKDMDCCKGCCNDMAKKHEGHSAEHRGHDGR